MKNKKMWKALAIAAVITVSTAACAVPAGNVAETAVKEGSEQESGTQNEQDSENQAVESGTASTKNMSTAQAESNDLSDLFTERDLSGEYDMDEAVTVTFDGGTISVDGAGASADGSTLTVTDGGTYVLSGTLKDGQIYVDADGEKVQLVLSGVTVSNDDSACILVKNADKVFITLADGTENYLSDSGSEYVQTDDDMTVDGVIFSKDDITINGSGSLTVQAGYSHGIVTKDDLKITGGTIIVNAADKGLSGKDSVRIGGGDITVTAGDDAIHSSNSEDEGKGYVVITDGTVNITAGDDGIHAEQALTLAGGTVSIAESYEGLEGKTVDITGGDISITAKDDGINAAYSEEDGTESGGHGSDFGGMNDAQEECVLTISGGTLYVNAGGDGIDSNGYLYVKGGSVMVDGPENDGNGALDFGIDSEISGGTVIAAGSSGMAETFGTGSSQYSVLVGFETSLDGGTRVDLSDKDGNEILSAVPSKKYSTVVFSCEQLGAGSYTVTAGDQTVDVEISEISTRVGVTGGFGGGFGGFGRDRQNGERPSFGDGQTPPEMPDGERPSFRDGQAPPEKPNT